MSFDPGVDQILQNATNFFASAFPIVQVVLGVFIGGFVIVTLVNVIRGRST